MGQAASRQEATGEGAKKLVESSPLVEDGGERAGALDNGGEIPLFTHKTFGVLACMALSWVQRGATFSMGLSVFLHYLNAPANVVAAGASIVPSPQMFVLLPGLLSDCVPVCGSRRKFYCYLGAGIIFLAYLLMVVVPFPEPYYCDPVAVLGNATLPVQILPHEPHRALQQSANSTVQRVCNSAAPSRAGGLIAMLTLAQVGAVFLDTGLSGLILDYARREPLATRGRVFSVNAIFCLCGSAFGGLFGGLVLNTPAYGGTFKFGLGFPGLCVTFMCVQAAIIFLLAISTYEPPLPPAASKGRAAAALASIEQTGETLRSSFLVQVLVFHLLAELSANITAPSDTPLLVHWCNVTPLSFALTGFCGCIAFAIITFSLLDVLPNFSWRSIVLCTGITAALINFASHALIATATVRSPLFALSSTFLAGTAGITTMSRQLVANYVITEVTSGANQATLGALFITVHSLGSPLGRAIAEPLFGLFEPSMAEQQNYLDDTPAFRQVVLSGAAIAAGFACTLLLFIRLLPDSKATTQEGMRSATRRSAYLYLIVSVILVAMIFAVLMTVAPLFPKLACMPIFGGGGCE